MVDQWKILFHSTWNRENRAVGPRLWTFRGGAITVNNEFSGVVKFQISGTGW
jgi:hypothetical protein